MLTMGHCEAEQSDSRVRCRADSRLSPEPRRSEAMTTNLFYDSRFPRYPRGEVALSEGPIPKGESEVGLVRTVAEILDQYSQLYSQLTAGRASRYVEYVDLHRSDEEKLIQPTLFPDFLEHVLGFSRLEYIPELPIAGQLKPDFTPIDPGLHPFIFETKGSDSTHADLESEYRNKTKQYLDANPRFEHAVITNMSELLVFEKESDRLLDDYSFDFVLLYRLWKSAGTSIDLRDANVARFLKFVRKFHKRPLSLEDKTAAIAQAKPYPPLDILLGERYRELETLTESVRRIIEWLRDDVAKRGGEGMLRALRHLPDRKRLIAMEVFATRSEVSGTHKVPQEIEAGDLDSILQSNDRLIKAATDLYFYRVAYFMMARILLVRAWEDSRFIEERYHVLFDGGFARWYIDTFNRRIADVLKQAFAFARERYEWLFTDQTNYSWFLPSDETLVNVLYEFAKYNLSVLNRDVLGTVYEEYLDVQDKKNKGQYYTPYPIVELIWDLIGFSRDSDFYRTKRGKRVPKKVFDPATGSGGFLVEAARRVRSGMYPSSKIADLEDIKSFMVGGLFGSEISVFSYYITEINLLLQLTPVIKRIIELDSARREIEGKFTLSVIRQDSLGLHNQPDSLTEEGAPRHLETYYGIELLKPTGEKLRVYDAIRNGQDFDYAVANPPYIGEDGHKDLFRRTLDLFPYWRDHYQGKMDYLYFFVILALQKLAPGGRLGFITTSYWLTADGASKLRTYILENARIVTLIDFHEIKLFEHAKGQHSLVFVLERTSDPAERATNRIRVAEVKKEFEGSNVNERIRKLCSHLRTHTRDESYSDEFVEVYTSPVVQGDLASGPWHLFQKEGVEVLLNRIRDAGGPLQTLCDVNQGLISRAHKVDKSVLSLLPSRVVQEEGIKVGDGVFVLSPKEVEQLALPAEELALLKPFFKNSDIRRYVADEHSSEYVIYATAETRISQYPKLSAHLGKYRTALETKRNQYGETYPWFKLHRERDPSIFEGEKIVCPFRSNRNTFAYSVGPFYGSTDMYFITPKESERLDQVRYDLRYILGVLNSNALRLWTLYRTKAKGRMRELFYEPLKNFPIPPIDFSMPEEANRYALIVELVPAIVDVKRELQKFERLYGPASSETEEGALPPPTNLQGAIHFLRDEDVTTLSRSPKVSFPAGPDTFKLKSAGPLTSVGAEGSGARGALTLKGIDGVALKIEGDWETLGLLKSLLKSLRGRSLSDLGAILIPRSMATLGNRMREIHDDVLRLRAEADELQAKLDQLVCELFDVEREPVDRAISESVGS